eukprot:6177073-Pleurochrysis_carterae.AAC.4
MRKRKGVTHATHRSKTTGAVGVRKSEAAKTGRHAAWHASPRKGEGASGVGLNSAVGAPASPTAMEKATRRNTPAPTPSRPTPAFACAHWLLQGQWDRHRRVVGRWVSGRGWLERWVGQWQSGHSSASGARALNVDGLQDRPNEVAQLS